MPRVIRRGLNVLAVLSLALCVAPAVMWVRSNWRTDLIWWGGGAANVRAITMPGAVRFTFIHSTGYVRGWNYTSHSPSPAVQTTGFDFRHNKGSAYGGWEEWSVAFPWSVACLICSAAPAIWLLWYRHTRIREEPGRCRHCGYDLRATPDRCPECGLVPKELVKS